MADVLYHYTTAAFAQEVLDSLTADPWECMFHVEFEGIHGIGMYALDVHPDDESVDELKYLCFNDWRPEHPMDGALELDNTFPPPFREVADNVFLLDTELPDRVDLGPRVTAVYLREGNVWQRHDVV